MKTDSSKPSASRPAFVFKSCTTGSVLSPSSAKPPVPELRFVAFAFSSSRNTPMDSTRKLPHASIVTVARLRERRRVVLRMPRLATVSAAAASLRSSRVSNADVNASAAMSNNPPALKNAPAFAVCPVASAQPSSARATAKQAAPSSATFQCRDPPCPCATHTSFPPSAVPDSTLECRATRSAASGLITLSPSCFAASPFSAFNLKPET